MGSVLVVDQFLASWNLLSCFLFCAVDRVVLLVHVRIGSSQIESGRIELGSFIAFPLLSSFPTRPSLSSPQLSTVMTFEFECRREEGDDMSEIETVFFSDPLPEKFRLFPLFPQLFLPVIFPVCCLCCTFCFSVLCLCVRAFECTGIYCGCDLWFMNEWKE